jgi:hypothetical protein
MRTTLHLPDELHAQVKARAAELGVPMTELFQQALRLVLRADVAAEPQASYRVDPLPAGDGVRPGVDITDGAALADLMDGR